MQMETEVVLAATGWLVNQDASHGVVADSQSMKTKSIFFKRMCKTITCEGINMDLLSSACGCAWK